ncbi:MAG: phage holin family protein [Lachnospiraceae bacterium]|nr:phage holin family protein [Lachnospiraceae bacterium]
MERYLMLLQVFLAGVIAWLSDRLGLLFPMLAALCFLMVIDYITGMLASKRESIDHPSDPAYGWSSAKGAKGILKKVAYVCVIAVAMVLDYMIMVQAAQFGLDMPKSVFFGLLVTAWYILNEILSIAENAGRMGADVPEWLLRYIAVLKKKIDDKGDGAE